MASGDRTPGRRIYGTRYDRHPLRPGPTWWYPIPEQGDYWLDENTSTWYARTPGAPAGAWGSLANHEVVVHDDGSITASPSILIEGGDVEGGYAWHGYLEHGTWREA